MTISSTFDTDTDGWTMYGGGTGPVFVSDGAGGGSIASTDAASDDFYYQAPDRFLGDRSGYFGGTLSFALRQSGGSQYDATEDVVLVSGSGTRIYASFANPGGDFTAYSVALSTAGGWRLASGDLASTAQIRAVLSDLAALRIIGEFVYGSETSGLDTVVMQEGAAVQRFEGDPDGPNPGASFDHANLAEALAAAAAGQWIVVNDATSPGGLQTVTVDGLHVAAPEGFAAQLFLADGVTGLALGGAGFFQVAGNALANLLSANAAGSALSGNAGADTVRGAAGNDSLEGGDGRDLVSGGGGADDIHGGSGDDRLRGDAGADTLSGEGGKDQITGGNGHDSLTGGAGGDRFIFATTGESGRNAGDVITDFTVKPGSGAAFLDRIDLAQIDAMAGTDGDQAFSFIGAAAFTAEGQIRAVQSGADTLVLVNTSGSGGAEMQIVLQDFTASTLTGADFLL